MNPYVVGKVQDNSLIYYFIRAKEDMSIMPLPTKYLTHRTKAKASPNTTKRIALSISYYLVYLETKEIILEDVLKLPYDKQHEHFVGFLMWLKEGGHTEGKKRKMPSNSTCNTYLRDVFGWFQFLEFQYDQLDNLKVLSSRVVSFTSSIGLRFNVVHRHFEGYLIEDEHIGHTIGRDNILILLEACTNCRDQLLLLLLAETGFRIGELLGVRYTEDIDFDNRTIRVEFRTDNDNNVRAKYAEYRRAKVSNETFEILMYYLAEYRELLEHTEYLFVILSGATIGQAEKINTVYAMLKRLEQKTGVKATPHMLRHYFANERYESGWNIVLIQKALGHKQISTTEKYLDVDTDKLSKATDEYYKQNKSLYAVEKLI